MNIAIISPGPFSVPPVKGSSVEHDIDEVTKMIEPMHNVTIYTRQCATYPTSSVEENRQFIRVPYQGPKPYLRRIINHIKKNKPDVILVENRPIYVLTLKRHFPKIPVFVNMHSHVYGSQPIISKENMRRAVRLAAGFITNSEFLRQHFIRTCKIPANKIHAVHLGVDVTPYQVAKIAIKKMRQELGLKPDDRILFYAGRLMRGKGVHVLIKAFRQVSKQDPKARLVIVGGTGYGSNRLNPYVRELKRLAKPLGEKVRFVNFVPSAKMPLYYQIGDVVATPSVWKEAFCRVNLEAMASGKPVISTPRGGIREVVAHEKSGFIIPPKDWEKGLPAVWELLWSSPAVRNEMGKQALQRAKFFSWYATAQGYLNVFETVVPTRREEKQQLLKTG
ncbi:glycosyltransferase family 4 protein [Brevibacillus brevis]|uniref:glycosyltransferase family 4 protein n=1 Tax=Brevibacillus brevis TaxID=1393 RepID=UPI000D0FF987|nr:glycosyltransferase family 4 protein [Brevibacillus brevis]PSJ70804.1 glycosyltransferase family 1 protein [Brevibacillus brevis]RED31154.1 spore coat protein SA [Brevibacillus brevis]GEC89929.1 LPS 1,2-N-acetylglucosaminetransferase [Brevibacillus brevis]VEF89632.1 Spore coat protein SA [Brevibacillus brevis]